MNRLAKTLLRRLGYEIRRLPAKSQFSMPYNGKEIDALEDILDRFAYSRPSSSPLSDVKQLRAYLSDDRILLFHEILAETQQLGIELENRKVADVGCGMGYLLRLVEAATQSVELFGFDTFAEMNELARMFCPTATVQDLPLQAIVETFDIIYCTEVLEHLVDPAEALRKLFHCLTPSGVLILTVPDGRIDQHAAREIRSDGSAYWGHINFWSPESWPLFLNASIEEPIQVVTCLLKSGKNFAAVSRAALTSARACSLPT